MRPFEINPQEVLHQAIAAIQQGRTEEAESALRDYLVEYPSNPYALYSMGVIESRRGSQRKALAYLEASLRSRPDWDLALAAIQNLKQDPATFLPEESKFSDYSEFADLPNSATTFGFIQSRGLGDIIIAAPIAQYFIDRGHKVFWPVDFHFFNSVKAAFPSIDFLRLDRWLSETAGKEYFLDRPAELLREADCARIVPLYSFLGGLKISDAHLGNSLKFDEYKYARCNIPFRQKWNLRLQRSKEREQLLFNSLRISENYFVVHRTGSNASLDLKLNERSDLREIQIDGRTDNPFDWLTVIERAQELHMIDSMFANIVEQLNLHDRGYVYLRSPALFTPVFKNLGIRYA
jgi:tetratricopeptide (TPR) repeat protein